MLKQLRTQFVLAAVLIALTSRVWASATIREVTGPDVPSITPTVTQFRTDLGSTVNAGATNFLTGHREIKWDDAGLNGFESPTAIPANFYNVTVPSGVSFSTPGSGFQVSARAASGKPVRFGTLNANYTATFAAFSGERLFTPVGSNVMDVTFVLPGTNTPATVSGFGAVFTDVDVAGSTNIQYFDAAGQLILSHDVLATSGTASMSFLGVSFTVERVARVRITCGNTAIGPDDGPNADVVVMDDFIYGEPQRLPVDIFGLVSGNSLVRFSSADPATIISSIAITGLSGGENLQAIDFRPANGLLYGIGVNGASGHLYTIDPATGVATQVSATAFSGTLTGTNYGMDFNPVADRIRIVDDTNKNFRLNPVTGTLSVDTALAYGGTDPNAAATPLITAAAYDRSFVNANSSVTALTTLFAIDTNLDILVRIGGVDGAPSPNGGVVTTIGALGVDTSTAAGLDIAPNGAAYALLTVGGTAGLYQIDLTTGAAVARGNIGNALNVLDLAVAPGGLLTFSAPVFTVTESVGTASITVNRNGGSFGAVTVDYTTIDGTAASSADFTATSGTLAFAEGDTQKTISIPIFDDVLVEGNEQFRVTLSKPTGGAGFSNAPFAQTTNVIITDNDDGPRTLYAVTNPGNNLLKINADTPGVIDQNTAVSGLQVSEVLVAIDFRPADGKLYAVGNVTGVGRLYTIDTATAQATQVGGTFALNGTDFGMDFDPQADKLRLVSNSRQNLLIDPSTAAVTIQGTLAYATGDVNQVNPPNVAAIAYDNSFAASTSPTLFAIDTNSSNLIRATSPGFADGIFSTVGTASFGNLGTNPGNNVLGLDIAADGIGFVNMNTFVNGVLTSELFNLNTSTGALSLIGTLNTTAGAIQDIAIAPRPGQVQLTANSATVKETDGTVTFTVTRTNGLDGPVTVNYTTADVTATAGSDYTATIGSVTFGNLEATKTITIPILNNLGAEPDETFTLTLTTASNGAVIASPSVATVTIQTDPGIVSPLAVSAPVNTPFSYTIVALGTATITYNATNLPPGLSFAAGVISGTPTDIASFNVTISATNALGTDTQSLVLTFDPLAVPGNGTNSSVDADGDGFADEVETQLGSSPLSSASTPFTGNLPADKILPLLDVKLGIKLSFSKPNTDSISLSGTLPVSQGLVVAGQKILVDVGGVMAVFTLDPKGTTPKANNTFKISVKAGKVAGVYPQTAKFSAKLSKGSFAAMLTDEGLDNTTVKNAAKTIPITMVFNENEFRTDVSVLYSAKQGSSGSVKMVK